MTYQNHFDKRLENIPSTVIFLLTAIDELKGRWLAGVNLHPQVLGRLKQSVLITSTGASTRIEGARLEDQDVENVIKGLSLQKFRDRDVQEVQGYYELLAKIFDAWKTIKLTESTIKHFHQEMLKYVEKDTHHRGKYKNVENKVRLVDAQGNIGPIIFDTTPSYLTPIKMQELVEWTRGAFEKKKYHPLLIIGNFITEFLKIHPFTDGNGRLSRILTNLLMLQAGYLYIPYSSHEKLIEDKKPEYYLALRKSQKTFNAKYEDILPWLEFFLKVLLTQSEMAISLLSQEAVEQLLSKKQLSVWQYLQEVEETTPRQIAQKTQVARPTINQVLTKLLKLKKIERIGQGSGIRYRKM